MAKNAKPPPLRSAEDYRRLILDLEYPIYNLRRLLCAAAHLQDQREPDLVSTANLLVDKAAEMAVSLSEQYRDGFEPRGAARDDPDEAAQ